MDEQEFEDIQRQRFDAAEAAREALHNTAKVVQGAAFTRLLAWVTENLDTSRGRVSFSAANLSRVSAFSRLVRAVLTEATKSLLRVIVRGVDRLLGLNNRLYSPLGDAGIRDEARRRTLLRLGYDSAKEQVLPGSYLADLFGAGNIGQRVAALVNRAIGAQMPLEQFRAVFRNAFLNAKMLERHYTTLTFDLFQRVDRTINLVYAERLGLKHALYAGTVIETTRPFCEARNQKVYTEAEIESWAGLTFSGKPAVYDPKTDCGGHNCRHHLSWITPQLYELLKRKQG